MKTLFIRNVPEELHRQIKMAAAAKGQTMERLVLDTMLAALNGKKPTAKK